MNAPLASRTTLTSARRRNGTTDVALTQRRGIREWLGDLPDAKVRQHVGGTCGPVPHGEVDRARAWARLLAPTGRRA